MFGPWVHGLVLKNGHVWIVSLCFFQIAKDDMDSIRFKDDNSGYVKILSMISFE